MGGGGVLGWKKAACWLDLPGGWVKSSFALPCAQGVTFQLSKNQRLKFCSLMGVFQNTSRRSKNKTPIFRLITRESSHQTFNPELHCTWTKKPIALDRQASHNKICNKTNGMLSSQSCKQKCICLAVIFFLVPKTPTVETMGESSVEVGTNQHF